MTELEGVGLRYKDKIGDVLKKCWVKSTNRRAGMKRLMNAEQMKFDISGFSLSQVWLSQDKKKIVNLDTLASDFIWTHNSRLKRRWF